MLVAHDLADADYAERDCLPCCGHAIHHLSDKYWKPFYPCRRRSTSRCRNGKRLSTVSIRSRYKIVLRVEGNRYVPRRNLLTDAALCAFPEGRTEERWMSTNREQFECLMEPTETWMVWDAVNGRPAQYMGNNLIGLPREKALLLCRLLNSMVSDGRFRSLAS
jgi:hypothetical protein